MPMVFLVSPSCVEYTSLSRYVFPLPFVLYLLSYLICYYIITLFFTVTRVFVQVSTSYTS
jgi:hypothetical protein